MTLETRQPASSLDLRSVHHDGSPRYVKPVGPAQYSALRIGDEVVLRVRAASDLSIERMLLRTEPDGEQLFTEMAPSNEDAPSDGPWRWWRVQIALTQPVTRYRFALLTPAGLRWLNGAGLHEGTPTDAADFRLLAGYVAPQWLEDAVVYQIFPDRFAGDGADVQAHVDRALAKGLPAARRRWDEPPGGGRAALFEFYGGDLAGIESHLDHLESLGVNAIYLTPIFESWSNHGYDCIDYEHVAAHLGGDAALASLRAATRARGMRLILDVAPNHVGNDHPWFREASADPTAQTAGFFSFREHPDDYESWLGHRSLAKLNYASAPLREAMYEGPDAVMRRWLREPYAIDGWRIDVANMLGRLGPDQLNGTVARGIRSAVRQENDQAYLVGENWFDATAQLQGDEWDGAMDYAGFTTPLLEWLAGIRLYSHGAHPITPLTASRSSTAAFVETLTSFRAAIPWIVARQQMLLLGSHDTARIRTALGNDPRLVRLAFGLLLTYPGLPCIYYGDEVGLEADGPLAARGPMPWRPSEWDRDLLDFVRKLVQRRREWTALKIGGFQLISLEDDSVAYLRDTDDDVVLVLAHRGPATRAGGRLVLAHAGIAEGTELRELFSEERTRVENQAVLVPPMEPGIAIWHGSRPRNLER